MLPTNFSFGVKSIIGLTPVCWHLTIALSHYIFWIRTCHSHVYDLNVSVSFSGWTSQIARFMGPTWGPPGSCRPQMGPMLAQWTLLSGVVCSCKVVGFLPRISPEVNGFSQSYQFADLRWCLLASWNNNTSQKDCRLCSLRFPLQIRLLVGSFSDWSQSDIETVQSTLVHVSVLIISIFTPLNSRPYHHLRVSEATLKDFGKWVTYSRVPL